MVVKDMGPKNAIKAEIKLRKKGYTEFADFWTDVGLFEIDDDVSRAEAIFKAIKIQQSRR